MFCLFRNCLVYPRYNIKISDCGSVRSVYNSDYYTSLEGGRLPIRWMAWESVVLVGSHIIQWSSFISIQRRRPFMNNASLPDQRFSNCKFTFKQRDAVN